MPSLSTMGRKIAKCSTASEGGAVEQPASDMDVKLLNIEEKLDKLVDVVAKMGDKVQAQASATPLSPVPAGHSSLRVDEEGNKQLPTFEELNMMSRNKQKWPKDFTSMLTCCEQNKALKVKVLMQF